MPFRTELLWTSLSFAIAGTVLMLSGMFTPAWTDAAAANTLMTTYPSGDLDEAGRRAFNASWHNGMDALRTDKWPLFDAGTSLIALGLSMAVAVYLLGIRSRNDLAALQTPRSRWVVYVIGCLAWFGLIGDTILQLYQDYHRHFFPPWADTLAIPLHGVAELTLMGWILSSVLGWLLVLRRAALPANLWIWRKDATTRSWLFTILATLSLTLAAIVFSSGFSYGPFSSVPVALLWAYATLIARAAAIARR